jgi:hypothetical protein
MRFFGIPIAALLFAAIAQPAEIDRFREAVLRSHNELRAIHRAPPLILDKALNKYAEAWADRLAATGQFTHSRGPYGENLAYYGSSLSIDGVAAGLDAVKDWGSEVARYRYGSGFSSATGHFTQMVWAGSSRLGCGMARGPRGRMNTVYIVCNYDPPGNYEGEFRRNVLP